jgi:hypothetical protein
MIGSNKLLALFIHRPPSSPERENKVERHSYSLHEVLLKDCHNFRESLYTRWRSSELFKLITFLCFVWIFPVSSILAGEFTWSGQIRQRTEWDGKDFSNRTAVGGFGLLRTRLNLAFTDENTRAFFQIQDSRKFGTETNTLGDGSADLLDFHQAYLQIDHILGRPFSVRLGRMEVVYANERLVGAVGWHNVGRAFDGVLAKYEGARYQVDVFQLKLVELDSAGNKGDYDFRGVWVTTSLLPNTRIDGFYLNDLALPGENFSRITTGIYSKGNYVLGKITVTQETDVVVQRGSNSVAIRAFLVGVRLATKFRGFPFQPELGAGYDFLSGDDSTTADYEAFHTLYPTNHKYYGYMDYFLNIPVHAQNAGLVDFIIKGGISPISKLRLKVDYHLFQTAVPVNGIRAIGKEIDITTIVPYRSNVKIVGGYSTFFPGSIFKAWKGKDPSNWYYLMTIYNF